MYINTQFPKFYLKKLVDIGGIPFFPEYKIAVKQNKKCHPHS